MLITAQQELNIVSYVAKVYILRPTPAVGLGLCRPTTFNLLVETGINRICKVLFKMNITNPPLVYLLNWRARYICVGYVKVT